VVAAYLASLLQLGELLEAAGLADEAVHALREGQGLVSCRCLHLDSVYVDVTAR
jgi:hypothetical protein